MKYEFKVMQIPVHYPETWAQSQDLLQGLSEERRELQGSGGQYGDVFIFRRETKA